MDWKKLIDFAAPALVETLVPGGSLLVNGVEVLAEVLDMGGASEEEVYKAIEDNPELLALKIAEVEARVAERQADSVDLNTVNRTIIEEIKAEGWYKTYWRPTWGWLSAILFFEVGNLLVWLAYKGTLGGESKYLNDIPPLVTAFSTFFAIPMIVLGVQVYQRSKEKRARLGETIIPKSVINKLKELF